MTIKIEYNSKVHNASQAYILDSIFYPYLKWQQNKTFKNFVKIPTHTVNQLHYHRHYRCALNIISGHYKKLIHTYVKQIIFDFEDEDKKTIS